MYKRQFSYYDASAVALSSVSPAYGPVAGGTALTVVGASFYDLGARLGFVGADNKSSFVPASIAHGEFSGLVLRAVAPAAPDGVGDVALELGLNGGELPPAATALGTLHFTYVEDGAEPAERERRHFPPSPPPPPPPPEPPGEDSEYT